MTAENRKQSELTSGSRLAKNTLWNLLGQGSPMLVGLVTIPLLIRGLGTERFGILALAWMVIGYFSLFDFGLGRALTKLLAEKLGAGAEHEIPGLAWTALAMMGALGVVGTLVLGILTPWLTTAVLTIPDDLRSEATGAFYVLAATVPVVISTTALRGILEAYQRFDLATTVRIPMGLWNFLGPLAVMALSGDLVSVVCALTVGRVLAGLVHLLFCLRVVPGLRKLRFLRRVVRPLLSFGGWMTVSNVVGPLMVYLDRFVIGMVLTMSAVAYYVTPYEIVTRLSFIPVAIVGVLFPAFSADLATNRARAGRLFARGTGYIFLVMFPIILIMVTFAQEGLIFWLGQDLAKHSAPILQWLAVGVLVNSLARMPFSLIQADGRPDLTAKLHMLELPVYLVTLWLLLRAQGIEGAAMAWAIRIVVDTMALYALALLRIPQLVSAMRGLAISFCVGIVALLSCTLADTMLSKSVLVSSFLAVFFAMAWRIILGPEERHWIWHRFSL